MASTATSSSGGVSSSMWANQPPSSKSGWGRSGEQGSAFRGMGRGRAGRGGGRGGRGGGRGGSKMNGTIPPRTDDKGSKPNGNSPSEKSSQDAAPPPVRPSPAPANDAPSPAVAKAAGAKARESKQPPRKNSEAKPPRKLPPIIVEPPQVAATPSPTSATTPSRSRRRRSQNRSISSMSMSSKKSPSSESSTSYLRPEKSPVVAKDLPPHLVPPPLPETPSFDIKHDIDALVERVRAVAMDRPNTPGSHIDWAGDDDDSLPDLDDWGVGSVTSKEPNGATSQQADLISPILADALKPLPNIGSPLATSTNIPPSSSRDVVESGPPQVQDKTVSDGLPPKPQSAPTPAKAKPTVKAPSVAKKEADKRPDPAAPPAVPAGQQPADKERERKKSPLKQSTTSLHPSLPAKPVGAIDALSKKLPRKPIPPVEISDTKAAADDTLPSSGVAESTHAPKPSEALSQHDGINSAPSAPAPSAPALEPAPALTVPEPPSQGVASSMHAPARSAPSHITAHAPPPPPPHAHSSSPFHPTHGRAHTVGRPGGFRVPFSPSQNSLFDGAGTGAGDERGSRRERERMNHARTHSSPPTGPGTSTAHARTVHASRPIITRGALNQIARSLGAAPGPKAKEDVPAVAPAPVAAKES